MPDSASPDAEPPADPAQPGPAPGSGARSVATGQDLRRRLADVVAQRNALLSERRAVVRLFDRMRADLAAAAAGVEAAGLLTASAALPGPAASIATSDLLPILVAGSGRSGTTTTAMLLDGHGNITAAPVELRFHASMRRGLIGLRSGALTVDDFAGFMRTHWFRRPAADPADSDLGLYRFMTHDQLDDALAAFGTAWPDSPEQACRTLIEAPIRAYSAGGSPQAWVEHTPANLLAADQLYQIFPDMRFVHVVRDGRDVASSVLRRRWGADDLVAGIRWWGHRLLGGHRRTRGLPAIHTVRFERLALSHRDEELARLLAFAGFEPDEGIHRRFASEVSADLVHQARWRDDVPSEAVPRVNATYRGVLERLRVEGVPVDELLEDAPDVDAAELEHEAIQQELYELRVENRLLSRENLELGAIAAAGELGAAREEVLARMRQALRSLPRGETRPSP